ncbi:MAG: hypothetical protein L7S64_05945 [Longimicrobiales bacterium]|nr:hypothetical protein [Longimicrobiales bacterium]
MTSHPAPAYGGSLYTGPARGDLPQVKHGVVARNAVLLDRVEFLNPTAVAVEDHADGRICRHPLVEQPEVAKKGSLVRFNLFGLERVGDPALTVQQEHVEPLPGESRGSHRTTEPRTQNDNVGFQSLCGHPDVVPEGCSSDAGREGRQAGDGLRAR